ncbi:MAG: hypothetical protein P4M07_11940 [Xanthobacteraceae bacterium]|nr:hypothetical protein [Xanthobacteraceae bacterium]
MSTVYLVVAVWAILALTLIPQALRRARRVERMTDAEIADARRLSERGICYDCGAPILDLRREKRIFDQCGACRGPD